MSEILNHRERRQKAKRDAKTRTCSKHVGARMIVKGTQLICPTCYQELMIAKMRAKNPELYKELDAIKVLQKEQKALESTVTTDGI